MSQVKCVELLTFGAQELLLRPQRGMASRVKRPLVSFANAERASYDQGTVPPYGKIDSS